MLKKRILEISKKRGSTHIGSCLSAVDIIDLIYKIKKGAEFILSNGHAFLAWAVVMEKHEGRDAFVLADKFGTHPTRSPSDGISVSTGSLGHGLGIAVGKALTGKEVYCLISDGESNEGSVWEALRIKTDRQLRNLHVYVNINGYTALGETDTTLSYRLKSFCPDIHLIYTNNTPDYDGVKGHYMKAL